MKDKIFIKEDDFGLDYLTNEKISYCLSNNLVSTTTLLANMPGFKDAIEKIHHYKFNGRVGIHFNLVDGFPVSDEMKDLLNGQDFRIIKQIKLKHFYTKRENNAIYHELKGQLLKIIDHDIFPTHIDSHSHTHQYLGILKVIHSLSKKYSIKYIKFLESIYSINIIHQSEIGSCQ